ncbi:ATP-binding protein [Actinophytocola sp.]|uniref:ATP-binding protein n=1 Tax=Actinophytocola sp. TaxID=1872138 RepID=UPI002ED40869
MDVVTDGGAEAVGGFGAAIEDLHCRVPAWAGSLTRVRQALSDWATRLGLAARIVEDVVLAAYEALANVVEHAYRDTVVGLLDLCARADRARGTVTVTVTDYGRWRPPPSNRGTRGRGLRLIRGLATHAEIRPSQSGTTVTMTYPLAGKAAARSNTA